VTDTIVYSDVDTIHAIHAIHTNIVAEDDETDPGMRTPGQVSSALTYIIEDSN
jgi:hypothetical protein